MTPFSARLAAGELTSVSKPTARCRLRRDWKGMAPRDHEAAGAAVLVAGWTRLLREDPLDQILDLGRVLGAHGLVFFLAAV